MKIKLHQNYVQKIAGVFYIAQHPKKHGLCFGCVANANDNLCSILSQTCITANKKYVTYRKLQ